MPSGYSACRRTVHNIRDKAFKLNMFWLLEAYLRQALCLAPGIMHLSSNNLNLYVSLVTGYTNTVQLFYQLLLEGPLRTATSKLALAVKPACYRC